MTIPRVKESLPELMQFTADLAMQRHTGAMTDWQAFNPQVRSFFTPAMMVKIEGVIPGWNHMASYADQQTLYHVTSVLTALYLLPEYHQATPEQQALLEWIVLFHDVAKIAQHDAHDYVHAFRSAAIAGKALASIGFPVTAACHTTLDDWFTLTYNAVTFRQDLGEYVQDNHQLPQIITGIECLLGAPSPAACIVKVVLLHLSIKTDPDYPIVAPLTASEVQACLDPPSFPLLKAMMLVDTDGWDLFDPESRQHHRQQTLIAFDQLGARIGMNPSK